MKKLLLSLFFGFALISCASSEETVIVSPEEMKQLQTQYLETVAARDRYTAEMIVKAILKELERGDYPATMLTQKESIADMVCEEFIAAGYYSGYVSRPGDMFEISVYMP